MSTLPLIFSAPFVLLALLALPVIWFLLRTVPPEPQRIAFPPLRIFSKIPEKQPVAARTPWWLLVIRMLICGLLVLACAGPVWKPAQTTPGNGPVLILIDNGFSSAKAWEERVSQLEQTVREALQNNRLLAVLPLGNPVREIELQNPDRVLASLETIQPLPYAIDRSAQLPAIKEFLTQNTNATIIWLSDNLTLNGSDDFPQKLAELNPSASLILLRQRTTETLALTAPDTKESNLSVRIIRATSDAPETGRILASDGRGNLITDMPFTLAKDAATASVTFDIPNDLRNRISRLAIINEKSAGAVYLLDSSHNRPTIGIFSGGSAEQIRTLLSPVYYIKNALLPFADIRDNGNIDELLSQKFDALVLADIGELDSQTTRRLKDFITQGGLLIRFAGNRLSAGNDDLLPVKLRYGDRNLGGALSWSEPRKIATFAKESPFSSLTINDDIKIKRQVLAEPTPTLYEQTWATLEDGTPLVTAAKNGKGMIVLYHVTATPAWSDLPLSGLFVEMLRKTIQFAKTSDKSISDNNSTSLPPRLLLDAFGNFVQPGATAPSLKVPNSNRASAESPPGFYGPEETGIAQNTLLPTDNLYTFKNIPASFEQRQIGGSDTRDLRAPLLLAALLLFLIDTLLMLRMNGTPLRINRRLFKNSLPTLLAVSLATGMWGAPKAQTSEKEPAALETRLAYILTNNPSLDATSKAGLTGLGQFLSLNTAFEPAPPSAVDPEKDELAFYPLIYWPISSTRQTLSDKAIKNINAYMKNGGTVLFDTRDALRSLGTMQQTEETSALRNILSQLDVPALEPVPADHVLTKTFYLLKSFPGRYDNSPLWAEASEARDANDDTPVRASDGVSPVLVTGNDFATAWAIGERNETLFPVSGSDPRQREMAFRAGANIVLYTLTGNYKADQVHVKDLLERMEREHMQ